MQTFENTSIQCSKFQPTLTYSSLTQAYFFAWRSIASFSAGYPWSVVRTSNGSWRFDIARTQGDTTPFLQFRSWVTDAAARRLMKLAGQDLDALRSRAATREFQPVKLGVKGKLNLKSELKRVEDKNVVGILEGSDPQLRSEYVVYSAHWDHLGVGAPNKAGDTIYNGAQDNATGVACVLAIADVIAQMSPRPKRSSLFLFPTAEEQGLLGAEWYAKHPVVPIDKTAANVNLDSMNVLGSTQDFIPLGAERSTLKGVVDAVAKTMGLRVSPDARPEQGSFYRFRSFPVCESRRAFDQFERRKRLRRSFQGMGRGAVQGVQHCALSSALRRDARHVGL